MLWKIDSCPLRALLKELALVLAGNVYRLLRVDEVNKRHAGWCCRPRPDHCGTNCSNWMRANRVALHLVVELALPQTSFAFA